MGRVNLGRLLVRFFFKLQQQISEDADFKCPLKKYELEIDAPEMESPLRRDEPFGRGVRLNMSLPSTWTVRVRSVYLSDREGKWSKYYHFSEQAGK